MIKPVLCWWVRHGLFCSGQGYVRCFCNSCRADSRVSSSIFWDSEGMSVLASSAESGQSEPAGLARACMWCCEDAYLAWRARPG